MKRFGKLFMVLALMLSLVLSLAACGGGEEEVAGADAPAFTERSWKIGHVRPQDTSTDVDVQSFVADLKAATDGNLTVEVYPASQLGNYTVVQERVGMGDIEMQLAPAGTSVDKAMGLSSAPYLCATWDEAREMYKKGSALTNATEEMFAEQGIKLLAGYPKYFGGIALAVEPDSPEDATVKKGIKIRVPGIKSYELAAGSLGFIATPIAYSEAFTSMQTGIVDGVIGSGAEGYYASFRDLTKYYLPVNDHFEIWWLQMSMDVWNDISVEEQEAIMATAGNMETARWAVAEEETAEFEQGLKDAGAVFYEFTDEELAGFAEKVRAEVWPEIKDEYGVELFDEVTGK
jgi:TRAP-type C4-dicarboxylate transport system substrate-binding protein